MVLGVEFAPLSIPLRRRLQTSAVILFICLFLLGHTTSWLLLILLFLIPPFTPFVVAYLVWMFRWDKLTPFRGGRPRPYFRRLKVWRYLRDYFPISLRRTVPLDPDGTYLFGCHPHGLASIGAVCNFATEATGFGEKFPGVDMRLMTLDMQFDMPLWRDLLMAQGMCSVSLSSCLHCLNNGISIGIVVGGAAEALDARPNNTDLNLASRRGFVKLAMTTGASLVPTFSFGENDLYNQVPNPPGSRLRGLQSQFSKTVGFSTPLFYGRGIFNYTFGFLPHRRPVTTVVGKAIKVEKAEDAGSLDEDEVNRVWQTYADGLTELFEENKAEFGYTADDHLHFV